MKQTFIALVVVLACACTSESTLPEPAACDDYVATVEKYVTCDKLPQADRDAVMRGAAAMRATWGTGDDSDAKRAAAASGACTTSVDSLRQRAEAAGC